MESVLAGLGFAPDDLDRPLRTFSGGWLMRVEVARLFLSDPDVLLLDEPTNHLDIRAREVLEEALCGYTGTMLFISHDRALINALARRRQHAAARCRMEAIEAEIEVLDAVIEAENVRLMEPSVYRDGERMRAIRARQEEARTRTARLEAEWEVRAEEMAALEAEAEVKREWPGSASPPRGRKRTGETGESAPGDED